MIGPIQAFRNWRRNNHAAKKDLVTSAGRTVGTGWTSAVSEVLRLGRSTERYTDQSLGSLRHSRTPAELLDVLSRWDPDVSAGIWHFIRTAESGFKLVGCDKHGKPSRTVQKKLNKLRLRLDSSYEVGAFTLRLSIEQLASQMLLYTFLRGAVAAELVPGPMLKAKEIICVDPTNIDFKYTDNRFIPYQQCGTKEISLDIPTFVWEILDPRADQPWEQPPILSAISVVMFRIGVFEDLQRVVKRIAYPRIQITLIEETLQANMPAECQNDPDEAKRWLAARKAEIVSELEKLSPEDALIMYDSVSASMLETGKNPTIDFRPLIQVIDQQIVSALKSLPTILGRSFSSSQTLSATESLLYIKGAQGIQRPAAKALSRLLTMALWLEGVQGLVKVKWNDIELRPLSELETHRSIKQSRILELLSLGFITDEEAQEELTGSPYLPDGHVPKSGTGFRDKDTGRDDRDTAGENGEGGSGGNPRARERTGGGRSPT
jgi:hypothetical protein